MKRRQWQTGVYGDVDRVRSRSWGFAWTLPGLVLCGSACSGRLVPDLGASNGNSANETGKAQSPLLVPDVVTVLGGNEPHVAINPVDPQVVAVSQCFQISLSFDGGQTFPTQVGFNAPPNYGGGGCDDVLAFDSQGRLFVTFLLSLADVNDANFGGPDLFVQQIDARRPASATASRRLDASGNDCTLPGANAGQCPVNVTAQLGLGACNDVTPGRSADRQWMAADTRPLCGSPTPARSTRTCSPFRDNLYLLWTDSACGSGGPSGMRVASSSDQGANWTSLALTAGPGDLRQCSIGIGANGDVYAAYHAQAYNNFDSDGATGQIVVYQSTTGAAAGFAGNLTFPFPAPLADITRNRQQCQCPNSTCAISGNPCSFSPTTCPGAGCECGAGDVCAPQASCPNNPIQGWQPCPRRLATNGNLTWGSQSPYVVGDPTNPNNIAVFASTDPNPAGTVRDNLDVSYVISTNAASGMPTWSPAPVSPSPNGVALPGTNQLFPMAVAAAGDSCVTVAYYDDRSTNTNALGNNLLDVYVTVNPNLWTGSNWLKEKPISHTQFDPDVAGGDFFSYCGNTPGCVTPAGWRPTSRMGEYYGLAPAAGIVWTGNQPGGQQILFNYSDAIEPVVTPPPPATVHSCQITEADLGTATATDVCGLRFSTAVAVNLTTNLAAQLPLNVGSNVITWSGEDGALNIGTAQQTVTVTDTTRPVFTATTLAPVLATQCSFGSQTITLAKPSATDDCGTVDVTGSISASSNPAVPVGTPLDNAGSITLPPGVYTVTWVATDGSGNTSAINLTQSVTIQPALHASDSIFIRENFSEVRLPTSGFANLADSGNGIVDIRNDARVGDILSVANVAIGYRARVGNVRSQDSIFWDMNAAPADRPIIASQTIGPVSLPAPLNLDSIVFPTTPGSVPVNDASQPPLAPGNYGAYTVNSGGVLTLQAGVYFFERLTIHSAGKVVATPTTVIYTKGSDHFQGPFVDSSNALVNVFIGFSGTTLNLENDFRGTIVAPNATVRMGTANAQTMVFGALHAKVIDLANGADLICDALPCASSICSTPPVPPAPTCSDGIQNGNETGVDCGGSCPNPCPSCNAASYEAETMQHSAGGPIAGGWNLFANGNISTTHNFTAGLTTVSVRALGEQANGVLPHMIVSVGGVAIGDANVATGAYANYDFSFVAPGGPQEIRVTFDNDFFAPPQDRNLLLDRVDVSCGRSFQMAAGLVSFEAEQYHGTSANGSSDMWTRISSGAASNGQAMFLGPDNGSTWTSNILSTSPHLDYNVNFTSTGTLYMHIRADAPSGASDSCFGGVDSTVNMTYYDFADTPNTWGWISRTIAITTPGIQAVHVWGREDGLSADKIVISTSATPPTGMGPPASPEI